MGELMRAMQYQRYGGPLVIRGVTAAVPRPRPGEVLVRVHGTSVNPLDVAIRRGLLSVVTGFRFPHGVGSDFAGEVVESRADDSGYSPGDRVWGFLPMTRVGSTGAGAEFLVARSGGLSRAPAGLDLVAAATLPMVGVTALIALRDHLRVGPARRLLIRGGAGGVGSTAVQLAKAMGAHVTALVGPDHIEAVRALGADAVLDYHAHGPDQLAQCDAILDLTGLRLGAYRRLLARRGRMVTTVFSSFGPIALSVVHARARIRTFSATPKSRLLLELAEFVERGQLKPVIAARWPLESTAQAQIALEHGGALGKQSIAVVSS